MPHQHSTGAVPVRCQCSANIVSLHIVRKPVDARCRQTDFCGERGLPPQFCRNFRNPRGLTRDDNACMYAQNRPRPPIACIAACGPPPPHPSLVGMGFLRDTLALSLHLCLSVSSSPPSLGVRSLGLSVPKSPPVYVCPSVSRCPNAFLAESYGRNHTHLSIHV